MTAPTQKLSREELYARLREILPSWPLYRAFSYSSESDSTAPPGKLDLFCPKCGKDQLWDVEQRQYGYSAGFNSARYMCRNCGKAEVRYYWLWIQEEGKALFMKIGQYPALEERVAPELESRLQGEDLTFYKNALRCRNFNLGLAALAYLRRVVENRMNDLLDLIGEVARDSDFEPELLEGLEAAKKSRIFDDKVTFAAKILPPNLKPGGTNPVDLLHDLASEGIHRKPEDECIEIFDSARFVFEYLFRELEIRKAEAAKFVVGIRALAARKAARKAKAETET